MKIRKSLLWVLLVLVFLPCAIARAQVPTGTIEGTVVDHSGAVVADAAVIVLDDDTGISRTLRTDSSGHYLAPSLALGNYRVTVTSAGFQTEVRMGLVLTVGSAVVVDIELSVGATTQTVNVSGDAPLVNSTTSSIGSLVDQRTIRALPLNGRSYDQLALIEPGVVTVQPGKAGGGTGTTFQFGTGTRFSVGGSRPSTNSFMLDGQDINDQANATPGGASGNNLGVDTIREFKILTSSVDAEYGRSSGAIITAVTRSGTNDLHGDVFEFLRNSVLDARNYFDVPSEPKPTFKRNQFGGILGGPIKKDKIFIFGGYEGLRQELATTQIATVPDLAARQGMLPSGNVTVNPIVVPYLALYPTPNGPDLGGGLADYFSAPTVPTVEDNFVVRVDAQLNSNTNIFGRYTFDQDSINTPGLLLLDLATASSRRQYAAIQLNNIIGTNLLNSARFGYNRSFQENNDQAIGALTSVPPFVPGFQIGQITIPSVTALGTNTSVPNLFGYNLFEWGDDLSYVRGKHSLKFGVEIERIEDNTYAGVNAQGTYTFNSLPLFLAGTDFNFVAGAPGATAYRGYRQSIYSVYAQDDIHLTSRLTLNVGLRYETATDPYAVNGRTANLTSYLSPSFSPLGSFFSVGKLNFDPRAGFAWQLDKSGKTVLRAGAGIFHDQLLPYFFANLFSNDPPFFSALTLSNAPFPDGYESLKTGGVPNVRVTAPYLKTEATDEWNLSIERQVLPYTVVTISYAGSQSSNLLTAVQENSPIPVVLSDGQLSFPAGTPRRNPNFGSIGAVEAVGSANYSSGTITIRRGKSTGLQYQASYTWARSMGISSGIATGDSGRSPAYIMDPFDLSRDYGRTDFDARNHAVFYFTYPLPFKFESRVLENSLGGWILHGIGTLSSGLPFTPLLSTNQSNDGDIFNPDRPTLNPNFSGPLILGTTQHWFNSAAYSLPAFGTWGVNDVGKNSLNGPGLANLDAAIEKTFAFRERFRLAFRAELFNILNHPNWALPNNIALTSSGAPSPNAGQIIATVNSSREIQFGLKFNF